VKIPSRSKNRGTEEVLASVHIHPKIFEVVAMDRLRGVTVTMAGEQAPQS